MNRMLNCLIFFQDCALTCFWKKTGRDLLSKNDAVMESVVDKEKLMECTRGNPVICKQVSVFHHHKNELNKLKIYLAFPNKFIINTWTVK